MIFLHKLILSNRYLRYTPFWHWYRLMIHQDYHLDDRFLYQDFWNAICEGQTQMIEDDKWLKHFGAKPEIMYVSQETYDELMRRINEKPKFNQKLYDLMSKKSPWDE